jgi:two-component system LytT family response regulator
VIRAVVVDDQPMARERLIALLAGEPDVEVVGSCGSGAEAVGLIRATAPDLVFLDMQMPELDGFGVIDAIGPERMPTTIFVTAYAQHAVRAFEVRALDYLLKPFGRARFQRALEHARHRLAAERSTATADRLLAVVDQMRSGPAEPRIVVRSGGRVQFVSPDRIDWVEAEGNYVRLRVGADSFLVRDTMAGFLARLGGGFFRIHRSTIVNVARIRELRLAAGGDYDVVLKDGRMLPLSRLYRDALQARLAGA